MGSAAARLSWGLGTLMVAIKSEEIEGRVATYMMAFTIGGEVIMEEERIGERKFEGIEFI